MEQRKTKRNLTLKKRGQKTATKKFRRRFENKVGGIIFS